MPTVTGINVNDLLNEDYEHYCGRFGILGQPAGNHIIQKINENEITCLSQSISQEFVINYNISDNDKCFKYYNLINKI